MKNFKKIMILSIIIISTVIYFIYNKLNESEEFIEEEVYVESKVDFEKTNKIILHITGEVNKPRDNTNRRGRKTC